MTFNQREYITTGEVAKRFGCSRESIRRLIQSGQLPAARLPPRGHWQIRRRDFESLLRRTFKPNEVSAP